MPERRLPLPGLAALLALAWSFTCPLPAAADQVNPAGNVISGRNRGLEATADGEALYNVGRIEVNDIDTAVGMGIPSLGAAFQGLTLSNSGSVNAYVRGGTASPTGLSSADAYGMWGGNGATLVNSGSVNAYARGDTSSANNDSAPAYAYGMKSLGDSTLVNFGSISVYAWGGIADSVRVDGRAHGMNGDARSRLTNYGSISANARGGATSARYSNAEAVGMMGWFDSTFVNSGSISANAWCGTASASTTANAYGMLLTKGGTAANFGVIRVGATGPGQLCAHELFARDGTVHIRAWALNLRDFSDTATRPFGAVSSGHLDFDGSTLIPRPGTPGRGFSWGREYKIEDMVSLYKISGTSTGYATGSVASAVTELPLLEARLRGSDWRDQTVSLHPRVNADTNPGQSVSSLNAALAGARMGMVDTLLAAHLAPASRPENGLNAGHEAGAVWTGFMTPYYRHLSGNAPDYAADSAGLAAGGSVRFHERLALGGHMGFDRTKSSGDLMNMDGRTLTGFAGLHGMWNPTPVWYLRGQITGFLSHGSHSWTGGRSEYPLNSDADVNGHGLYAALRGAYVWNLDARNTLTPELGLDWLWTHQDAFSLNWTGGTGRGGARLPEYAMDFRAENYSALSGTALLRWRGDFALGGGRLLPTLGLGLRQSLTDDDVQSRLRFAGSSFTTQAPADDTSALAEAGLAWTRDNVAVGLAYAGEYGSHRQSHAGRLTVRLEF